MFLKTNLVLSLIILSPLCFSKSITLPDGSKYEGELKDGLLSGSGTIIYSNGNHYEGEFENGMFNGFGIFKISNNSTYEGEYKDGKKHGTGKYYGDSFSYEGNFIENKFSGEGSYTDYDNLIFTGNFKDWNLEGDGQIIDEEGNTWKGKFEFGDLIYGEYQGVDGTHYIGEFQYEKFDGQGEITHLNGDKYIGEFSWGLKEGEGRLINNNNEETTGLWSNDKYQGDPTDASYLQKQRNREIYLYNQQELLNDQFSNLTPHNKNNIDYYSLTIAAYGTQSVFASEVNIINSILNTHGINKNQQITLVNSLDNLEKPWATHIAIQQSLQQIEKNIDANEDVLFLYATSHGNAEVGISLNIHNMSLGSITPAQFSNTLKESKIKYKVIVISACYSGVFIDALKDDNSIIITAADSTHKSFGCSNDLEMTFFGKAYFQDAFKSLDFIATFNEAKQLVKEREKEQGYEFSNPQIFVGENIRAHLNLNTQVQLETKGVLDILKGIFIPKNNNTQIN